VKRWAERGLLLAAVPVFVLAWLVFGKGRHLAKAWWFLWQRAGGRPWPT
jgi:hypothetical protein